MNEKKFLVDYFNECKTFLNKADIADTIIKAKKVILATKESGGQLIFAGNGASASIANHASLDFTKQGKIRSVNFNESAFITAFSNDYGYENWKNWLEVGGFDNLTLKPNGQVMKILTKLSIENLLHPFQTFILGQKNLAPKIAKKFNNNILI